MLAASHCGYMRLIMLLFFFFLPKSQGDAFPELKKNPQMVSYVGCSGVGSVWGAVESVWGVSYAQCTHCWLQLLHCIIKLEMI